MGRAGRPVWEFGEQSGGHAVCPAQQPCWEPCGMDRMKRCPGCAGSGGGGQVIDRLFPRCRSPLETPHLFVFWVLVWTCRKTSSCPFACCWDVGLMLEPASLQGLPGKAFKMETPLTDTTHRLLKSFSGESGQSPGDKCELGVCPGSWQMQQLLLAHSRPAVAPFAEPLLGTSPST